MSHHTASAWILNLPAPALRKASELHESSDVQCLLQQTEWTDSRSPLSCPGTGRAVLNMKTFT